VVFESQVDLDTFLGLERDDVAEDEANLSAEVELGKADELVADGKATIRKVFRRRRLIDAATLVHGSVVPGPEGEVMADGLANLLQWLKDDIATLDAANQRLAESQKNIQAENDLVARQVAELSADLAEWARDVAAATTLADAYQDEAERAAQRLETTERKVVELGEEYDRLIRDLVRRIDAIAPPPTAAAAPAANF
jgi:chromosome segregation ATPase